VARRSRAAYGSDVSNFIHYLHYDVHTWHAGDILSIDAVNRQAEKYVRTPVVIEPRSTGADLTWQTDGTTGLLRGDNFTLFDIALAVFNK